MGISTKIDYEVIENKLGSNSYPSLVGQTCRINMKANISIEKYRIKLKGKGKKIVIPLDPSEGKPWDEPNDKDSNICWIYQIMKNNEDTVEPNKTG